jgi:peptidoglycan/xylan/chitin deacetylase (PgdA/CDA1 family)
MRLGVPALVEVGDKNQVGFTFFLNMGRAVTRKKACHSSNRSEDNIEKLSPLRKLGVFDFLVTGLLNPMVGASYISLLKGLQGGRHEFGLHGGGNHGEWMRNALSWSGKKIEHEIKLGLEMLKQADIKPRGFSSPGWVSPPVLPELLEKYDFEYFADAHGEDLESINDQNDGKMQNVPTNILGEPGGVGYIESCIARGMNEDEVVEDFAARLSCKKELAVVYDHPGFLSPKYIDLLDRMVKKGKVMGFSIRTMAGLVGSR